MPWAAAGVMERTLFSTTATKVSGPVIFITASDTHDHMINNFAGALTPTLLGWSACSG